MTGLTCTVHLNICTFTEVQTQTDSHPHPHPPTRTSTHACTHINTCIQTHTFTDVLEMCIQYIHTTTWSYIQQTDAQGATQPGHYPRIPAHAHTRTHTCTHTRSHARTHARTHTRTHTHCYHIQVYCRVRSGTPPSCGETCSRTRPSAPHS